MNKYQYINIKDIPKKISISKFNGNKFKLVIGRSRPIYVKLPLKLDENLAKVSAMLLDGSLDKNLYCIIFSQKKDKTKLIEISKIIKSNFGLDCRKYGYNVIFSNKTLCYFLYYCLDMYKCDEHTKIPYWIKCSPYSVKRDYVRYAFAMEGSIKDPLLRDKEIRFHSCDKFHTKELLKFLKDEFYLNFKFEKYFIKGYGWKYYLSITNKNEFIKFLKIGFPLLTHQNRLEQTIALFKPTAWQVTLVSLFIKGINVFTINQIKSIFPNLHKRTIHYRLSLLIKLGYLSYNNKLYYFSKKGINTALKLKSKIKIVDLRTKPRENENKILKFIQINKIAYRNQLARKLHINVSTVRDVLKRLKKFDYIKLISIDKFGRKFWIINNSGSFPKVQKQLFVDLNHR